MGILRRLLISLGLVASAQAVIDCNVQNIVQVYKDGVKMGPEVINGDPYGVPVKTSDCINCFGAVVPGARNADYRKVTYFETKYLWNLKL